MRVFRTLMKWEYREQCQIMDVNLSLFNWLRQGKQVAKGQAHQHADRTMKEWN